MAKQRNQGIPAAATIRPEYTTSIHSVTYSNENRGGHHAYNSIYDCIVRLTRDRMLTGMSVTILEDSQKGIPTTDYRLKKLPYTDPANPGVVIKNRPAGFVESNYTITEITVGNFFEFFESKGASADFTGEPEYRYSPDYTGSYYDDKPKFLNRKKPPFDNHDPEWAAANWETVLDETRHKWKSHRFGSVGPFSDAYPLYGEYEPKDFTDIRQLWVLREPSSGTILEPETPPYSLPDGNGGQMLNNSPVDPAYGAWQDIATLPAGANVSDYTLWEIQAPKNVYDQLKGPWTKRMIEINGDIIRYSETLSPDPNSLCTVTQSAAPGTTIHTDLENAGITAVPNGGYQIFRWKREKLGVNNYTRWEFEKIANESGEYVDFRFREFPEELVAHIINNPDGIYDISFRGGDGKTFRPTDKEPEGWSDSYYVPKPGYRIFGVNTRKFFNDELRRPWSDPTPVGGGDSLTGSIDSDKGNDFKQNSNQEYQFTQMTLTASMYMGDRLLNLTDPIAYQWTRIYNGGGDVTIDGADNFGTARTAVVKTDDVNGKAIFQCVQVWTKPGGLTQTLTLEYEILDIKDGLNARLLTLQWNSNIFFVNGTVTSPEVIRLRAIEENIFDADSNLVWKRTDYTTYSAAGFSWDNIAALAFTGKTLSIVPADFNGTFNTYVYYCMAEDSLGLRFYDEVEVTRIAVEAGADSFFVNLSNSTDQVATNADGTLVDPTFSNDYTKYQVFEGGVEVTNAFTVSAAVENVVSDGGTSNTVSVAVDAAAKRVKLSAWGTSVRSATATITFTRTNADATTTTLTKDFKFIRQKGFTDLQLVDIDSTGGFTFKPGDTTSKTLTANISKNSVYINSADYANYTIKWYDENSDHDINTIPADDVIPVATGRTYLLSPESVNFKNTVLCVVTTPEGYKISRKVDITEIMDSKKPWMLFAGYKTKPTSEEGVTAIPIAYGSSGIYKVDYAVPVTEGYDVIGSAYGALALTDAAVRLKRDGSMINTAGAALNNNIWVTDDPSKLASAAWADITYWVCYGKELDKSTVEWGRWVRIAAEKAAAGQNGAFPIDYYTVKAKSTVLTESNHLPYNSDDPANANCPIISDRTGFKGSITTRGNTWYKAIPAYDPATQRVWKISADIGFQPDNIKYRFKTWRDLNAFTGVDGLPGTLGAAGPGYNGLSHYSTNPDGSKVYRFTPVNGADAVYFTVPAPIKGDKGDPGAPGNNDIKMYKVSSAGYKLHGQHGPRQLIDTGNTDSKKLKITCTLNVYGDSRYSLSLGTMTSPESGELYNQRNRKFMSYSSGSYHTSYVMTDVITTSHRYINFIGGADTSAGQVYDVIIEVTQI